MDQQMYRQEGGSMQKKGAFKEIFGQFVTATFWKELAKNLVHEFFSMALMALGGTLYWYGKSKRSKDVEASVTNIGGGMSEKAFGGGSDYRPSTAFPVRTSPSGDARFPGFN